MLKEKRHLDFSSKNEEEYNLPFSVAESLALCNDCLNSVTEKVGCNPLHFWKRSLGVISLLTF